MLRISIIIFLVLLSSIINGQVSPSVNIDASSKDVTLLLNQKKIDSALSLVNRLIIKSPNDGINYFNKAVINYYKKTNQYDYSTLQNGKKIIFSHYDTAVVNNCKRAQERGYNNSELLYLVFLEYFNYNPIANGKRYALNDAYGHKLIGYEEQREFIDSAIKIKRWSENEKYVSARFELYINNEIVTTFFDLHQEDAPIIRSDCERIIELTKDKKRKFLAYYYLAQTYIKYYADTIKAINYLSRAIDFKNINNLGNKGKISSDPIYDNLYAERGKLRYDIADFAGAISDYNIHLTKWNDPAIYRERGWAYFTINNSTAALKDMNKAILLYEQIRKELLVSEGQTYKFADGSTAKSKIFILKELQIGSKKVTNVRASISNSLDAPLLLGQSALNRFGKITIDYKNGVIRFED